MESGINILWCNPEFFCLQQVHYALEDTILLQWSRSASVKTVDHPHVVWEQWRWHFLKPQRTRHWSPSSNATISALPMLSPFVFQPRTNSPDSQNSSTTTSIPNDVEASTVKVIILIGGSHWSFEQHFCCERMSHHHSVSSSAFTGMSCVINGKCSFWNEEAKCERPCGPVAMLQVFQ